MGRLLAVGSLVVAALLATQVNAQAWSNATCVDQLWSINSRQQSPCLVSAYLSAPCTSDNYWGVPEIGVDGPYSAPKDEYANVCRCNSVQWNLLSACSMCQGGPAGSWSEWVGNCSASVINIGTYPQPIPAGISIPHWAYYDFTGTGVFNAVIASQQSGPESSPAAIASSTAATAAATSGAATTRSLETSTALPISSTGSKKSSNTGPIVGGVVGGILGLALIGLIAFVLSRKSKNKASDANGQYTQGGYSPPVGAQPNSAAPMMGQYQPESPHLSMMSPGPSYDPSNPATFPVAHTGAPSQYTESIQYSQNPSQYRPGNYNGAPEV